MRKQLLTAGLYTLITAVMLGIVYPLLITVAAQILFPKNANGQLLYSNGKLIGSRILGQPFTGPEFFHSRPSSAGMGYDAALSSGSNLGPTSKTFVDGVNSRVRTEIDGTPAPPASTVPVDLVTASASGLDPDITPAAALYQVPRIAHQRGLSESTVRNLVLAHIQARQFGLLGEPRVNVLELNLDLQRVLQQPQQ